MLFAPMPCPIQVERRRAAFGYLGAMLLVLGFSAARASTQSLGPDSTLEPGPSAAQATQSVALSGSTAKAPILAPAHSRSKKEIDSKGQPSDKALLKVWAKLEAQQQHDLVEWYRLEMSLRTNFQLTLMRFILSQNKIDPGMFEERSELPYFDPVLHAPGQPIPRKRLEDGDKELLRLQERYFKPVPERRLRPQYYYDWPSGEVMREAGERNVEREFHNALQGFPPDLDLAEALVEQMLDDGSEREALAAFGHAYTDRNGSVFTGITLYDAWSSGEDFETPDVDTLGIVHTVLDEWKKWKAPVLSSSKQRKLASQIEDIFVPAHNHRSLRTALARVYLTGNPVLRDGYAANLDRFHALWELHSSTPEELYKDLPASNKWEKFLKDWVNRCKRDKKLFSAGGNRRWRLEEDARTARSTMVWVMREYGLID